MSTENFIVWLYRQGDSAAAQQYAEKLKTCPLEPPYSYFPVMNLLYQGKLREARKQIEQAIEAARRDQSVGDITWLAAFASMTEAEFGNPREAREAADLGLKRQSG